jgi:hypothetical protein
MQLLCCQALQRIDESISSGAPTEGRDEANTRIKEMKREGSEDGKVSDY